jgi:hypothetical protein
VKQKCVGIDGCRQIIGSLAAVLGVKEGKFGQGEEAIFVACGSQTRMQLGQRFLRVLIEALVQVEVHQLAR